MACKLYTQIRDCLMRETFGTTSLLTTSRQLLLYFFMRCAKPVMDKSTFLLMVLHYSQVSVKAVLKYFCKFHRNTTISHRHFLNKKRLRYRMFSTNFVKSCSKIFSKFHRNTTLSHRHVLKKKRLQHRIFSTNFVKCLKLI